jgi:hypothetical protein
MRYMHLSPTAVESAIRLLDQPSPTARFGDILGDGRSRDLKAEWREAVRW